MTRRFLNYILLSATLAAAQISARADTNDLIKSSVLESNVMYLRAGNIGENLPKEIQSAENVLAATNQIAGTVLDLRFAGGGDSDSEKTIVNSFAQKNLPVAILINDETSGDAIELAKQLRDAHAGLIFGSSTNLMPDIFISVNASDEKKFLKNPWGTISTNRIHLATMTNDFLPFPIDHTTEADLVRARIKDGDEDDTIAKPKPQKPFIRDPVLACGLDFIRGEAILRLSHL